LVRRGDGQVIQLPRLLYLLTAKADGLRSYDAIAAELTIEIRRGIDGDQVRFLAEAKLRPLGVLEGAGGDPPVRAKADPFFGLRLRLTVVPEAVSNLLGWVFQPMFLPVVVVGMLAAFLAADAWLFFHHGVAQAVRQSIYHPALFLVLAGAVVAGAAFHEVGHAAACRYGGCRPGKMGCGLYLAWPAFYTDVTDTYRLGRRARLRTDLGGVYFNLVIVVGTVVAYLGTGFEPLLLIAVIQHFEMAHQLLPVIRLDGYYIVADLTGVPDLHARIGPILRGLFRRGPKDGRVTALRRRARAAVTAWVVVVVPVLVAELVLVLVHLPRIMSTAWSSAARQYGSAGRALSSGHTWPGVSAVVQLVALAVPVVGLQFVFLRMARQSGLWIWRSTSGRPARRALALAGVVAAMTLVSFNWLPRDRYRPITPRERGTIAEGVTAIRLKPPGLSPQHGAHGGRRRAPASVVAGQRPVGAGPGTKAAPGVSSRGAAPSTTAAPTAPTQPNAPTTEASTTTTTTEATTTTSAPPTTTTSTPSATSTSAP